MRGEGPRDEFVRAVEPLRSDHDADHNYSVWLTKDPRVFQRLQWGGCTVVRTRDPNRFGRALALHLSGHGSPAPGLIRTEGVVAIHDGRATILPVSLRQSLPTYEGALRRAGVVLSDAPWADVDPLTGAVVLDPPPLPAARFAELVARLPSASRSDPALGPGRYPLAGWYFTPAAIGEQHMTVIDAVASALAGLRSPLTHRDQPDALLSIFEHTPFGRLVFRTPRQLLDQMSL